MPLVLITGGHGLVASRLAPLIAAGGNEVRLLSRSAGANTPDGHAGSAPFPVYKWNPASGLLDPDALKGVHTIIHLAGAGIADKRWTAGRKQVIRESRIRASALLEQEAKRLRADEPGHFRLESFITASAVGYYGARTTGAIHTEHEEAYGDFLGLTCRDWEGALEGFAGMGVRTVALRMGVVLSPDGGALPRLSRPLRAGVAAIMGSGRHYMPWIHIDDLCTLFLHAMTSPQMKGPYNAVAPCHITQRSFMRILAGVHRKNYLLIPVPSILLRIALGEMALVLTEGNRVSAGRTRATGFRFSHPDLRTALKACGMP